MEVKDHRKDGHAPISNGLADVACNESAMLSSPESVLNRKATEFGLNDLHLEDERFALAMDAQDPLAKFRSKFAYPRMKDLPCVDLELVDPDEKCVYLCGNSLGLKPKMADEYVAKALDEWGKWGVLSHFTGEFAAAACDIPGREPTAKLIGAKKNEVALMNGLSVNVHLLLVSFYCPTTNRHKILIESSTFPSDRYAVRSQIEFHGYDPEKSLLFLSPREGEELLRPKDIEDYIERNGEMIAVVWLSGVHYYTGQKYDMERITQLGHKKGCFVGFDLAHAVCNVQLELHNWEVDFAAWCSYKYMNSGAGGLAGIFVHEKHNGRKAPQFVGWWSNRNETRFEMREHIDKAVGAEGFRLSNPPPWLASLNMASLDIFEQTSIEALVAKQFLLTGYLETLVKRLSARLQLPRTQNGCHENGTEEPEEPIRVITPSDPNQRGNQLSLAFSTPLTRTHTELERRGVMCDMRLPSVIRVAPSPLYNSFHDVYRFAFLLRDAMRSNQSHSHAMNGATMDEI